MADHLHCNTHTVVIVVVGSTVVGVVVVVVVRKRKSSTGGGGGGGSGLQHISLGCGALAGVISICVVVGSVHYC